MSNPYCGGCQKVAYPSRSEAKRVLKIRFPGETGPDAMQAYRCPVDPYQMGWFHIGHKRGLTREQHRRKATERSDDRAKMAKRAEVS